MVFKGKEPLERHLTGGSLLNGRASVPLLRSIFDASSPGHDGAVIVQGNRVAAAACFLPLTVNPELSRTLGSRHRAAIGVTEVRLGFRGVTLSTSMY